MFKMIVSHCNGSFQTNTSSTNISSVSNRTDGQFIINILSLIVSILALLSNTAALIVMFGSRGEIRLTNNKYLVNLAFADLLRSCFMPFTAIARLRRNFIFGPIICRILPVVQGLGVAVDVFTLVCISVERYIAICHPLLILKLQSLRFSSLVNGLILFFIWIAGFLIAAPNILTHNLCFFPKSKRYKCEKIASIYINNKVYIIALVVLYCLIPMLIMSVIYIRIICRMYKNNLALKMRSYQSNCPSKTYSSSSSPPTNHRNSLNQNQRTSIEYQQADGNDQKSNHRSSNIEIIPCLSYSSNNRKPKSATNNDVDQCNIPLASIKHHRKRALSNPLCYKMSNDCKFSLTKSSLFNLPRNHLSSANQNIYRRDRHRRKALKLLIVIIVEFFLCWTPIYIYHTLGTFDSNFYRYRFSPIVLDLTLFFSFASALCNPFTYYFMSKRYRTALYSYLSCCCRDKYQLNRKNLQTKQLITALHLHQQENSIEYKQKRNSIKLTSTNHCSHHQRARSNTLQ